MTAYYPPPPLPPQTLALNFLIYIFYLARAQPQMSHTPIPLRTWAQIHIIYFLLRLITFILFSRHPIALQNALLVVVNCAVTLSQTVNNALLVHTYIRIFQRSLVFHIAQRVISKMETVALVSFCYYHRFRIEF